MINPYYINGSILDSHNMIDGRWVDMNSGLFIDITAVRPNVTATELGLDGVLMCKDNHNYVAEDIFNQASGSQQQTASSERYKREPSPQS